MNIRTRIACTNYDWAPKWAWFLFISPALGWAIGRRPGSKWWQGWFTFPMDERPAHGPHHYPQFSEDREREFFGEDF